MDKSWANTTLLDVVIASTDYEECQAVCQVVKTTFVFRGGSPAAGSDRVRGLDMDQREPPDLLLPPVLQCRGDHLLPGLCQEVIKSHTALPTRIFRRNLSAQ